MPENALVDCLDCDITHDQVAAFCPLYRAAPQLLAAAKAARDVLVRADNDIALLTKQGPSPPPEWLARDAAHYAAIRQQVEAAIAAAEPEGEPR